jgi:hypothetical protein
MQDLNNVIPYRSKMGFAADRQGRFFVFGGATWHLGRFRLNVAFSV